MSSEKYGLVIGVDFGTTYSGVSFVHTAATNPDVRIINEWPHYRSKKFKHFSAKVPTEITYPSGGSPRWGFQIEPGERRYSSFKLLLEKAPPIAEFDDPFLSQQATLPPGLAAVDLCTDFLRLLNEYLMESLEDNYKGTLDLAGTPFHYVLTTPANWSSQAQELTRLAALAAGMGKRRADDTLSMTTEPLAAATYVIRYLVDNTPTKPNFVGSRVLLCDLGGGTVDLIAYTIDSVRPLRISEIVANQGGRCGSVAIDKAYLKEIESRVGTTTFQNWPPARTDKGSTLMNEFVLAKHEFPDDIDKSGNLSGRPTTLRIGGAGDDENVGVVTLTTTAMVDLFTPTVDRVRALLLQQLSECSRRNHPIDRIFLVGGFSESNYLKDRCERWIWQEDFKRVLAPNPLVTVPRATWTAVVRGAAEHGLQQVVTSRVLNRHYGCRLAEPYDEKKHADRSASDLYLDDFSGKMTRDCATWFANKGLMINNETELKLSFMITTSEKACVELLTYAFDEAPARSSNKNVFKVGTIILDITNVSKSAFEKKTVTQGWFGLASKTVYQAHCVLIVKVLNGELKFECKTEDGKEIPGAVPTLHVD